MSLNRELLTRESLDRLDMLQWISERNHHVPVSDLAYLLDINEDTYQLDILAKSAESEDD